MVTCVRLVLPLLLLAACDDNMAHQPYADPDQPETVRFDPVPPGTVPRGALARAAAIVQPAGPPDLRRGRERYRIFCTPCHGQTGHGDGMAVRHGFPAPPSFHDPRLREVTLEHIVNVITEGVGRMYSYADRVEPDERWAIAAFIKALQFSQAAPLAELPAADRERLPP